MADDGAEAADAWASRRNLWYLSFISSRSSMYVWTLVVNCSTDCSRAATRRESARERSARSSFWPLRLRVWSRSWAFSARRALVTFAASSSRDLGTRLHPHPGATAIRRSATRAIAAGARSVWTIRSDSFRDDRSRHSEV